jgi:hypothetical protein
MATVMQEAIEELWEAVFSVSPCRGYIWKIGIKLSPRLRHSPLVKAWEMKESA